MKNKFVLILYVHKLAIIEASKFKIEPLYYLSLLHNSNIHLQTTIFISVHSAVSTYTISIRKTKVLGEGGDT